MNELERRNFTNSLESLAGSLPMDVQLPADLTLEDFARLLNSLHTVHRKSAFLIGNVFRQAVERFGDEAYQIVDGWVYSLGTVKNYVRLTEQIDPELWEEPIPDRHFFAIGQNVKDPQEQKRWIEHAKEHPELTADQLRNEIHEQAIREYDNGGPAKIKMRVCPTCSGHGEIIESEE